MLRFSTAGESHGEALVALLSGMPAGLAVNIEFVNRELWRRQQGYGRGGRMKIERDTAHILSGVRHGHTIGSSTRALSSSVVPVNSNEFVCAARPCSTLVMTYEHPIQ